MNGNYKRTLAKTAGFCFGVDRAVSTLYSMVESGKRVCTLGPIIHNPSVISDLEKKGVHIIEHPSQIPPDTTVVIRTHGAPKFIIDELKKMKADYIDLTCPFVMKIQKIVERHSQKDRLLLIAGDENHPEVRGFRSRWEGESLVYKNGEELDRLLQNHPEIVDEEVYVVAQTTFSVKEWEKTSKILKKLCTKGFFFDTICSATNDRQKEAFELSLLSDAMIVVGGRSSSNTAKLKAIGALKASPLTAISILA